MTEPDARARLLERVKARLLARGLPRLQMTLIVACTGAAGFAASFLLLHAGLLRLWLRYALAVAGAYAVFLLLVRLWLALQRRRLDRSRAGDGFDVDLGGGFGGGSGGTTVSSGGGFSAGGGRFGGGGASALFDESGGAVNSPAATVASAFPPTSSSGGSSSSFSFDLDGDEVIVIVVVVGVLAATVAASVWVIVSAPTLFAEVLVDGTLSAGLYRHVRSLDEESWLEAALRRTWIPFAVVALFFVAAGVAFHRVAPEAVSIGGVVRHVFGP